MGTACNGQVQELPLGARRQIHGIEGPEVGNWSHLDCHGNVTLAIPSETTRHELTEGEQLDLFMLR